MVRFHAALHNTRDTAMTATDLTHIVDRMALSLINVIVVIGLPLAAIGLFVQTL